MNHRTLLVAALLALPAGALFAQTVAPPPPAASETRIDKREAREQKRIRNGRDNGQLTPAEHAKLEQDQRDVKRAEAKAKYNGNVSPAEKARIEAMQDKESHDIRKQKHDAQVTPPNPAPAPVAPK